MRTILLLFIGVLGFSTQAQQYYLNGELVELDFRVPSTNPIDGVLYCDGRPCEGWLVELDSNQSILTKSFVRGGKHNGIYEEFYSSGKMKLTARMQDNSIVGTKISYFENGMISSVEYFPEEQTGALDGIEKLSYYPNGELETYYCYKEDWIPVFHFEFSESGDTLMKIVPLSQDISTFQITEFESGVKVSEKRFQLTEEGERVFLD